MRRTTFGQMLVVTWAAGACLAVLAAGGPRTADAASSPRAQCRAAGTDDRLQPIPASLVPAAVRLFHLEAMPPGQVRRSTYFRCAARQVLLCNVGANLPCGKADTRRHLPAAEAWCAAHPGQDFIPMYVTGHDTIYAWRCDGPTAAISKTVFQVDRRGFIRQLWKRLDGAPRSGGS